MNTSSSTQSQVKASSRKAISDLLVVLVLAINAALLCGLVYQQFLIEEQLELLIWMRDHCRFI